MAIQYGTAHIHGLSGATLVCSGFLLPQPNMQSVQIEQSADVEEIKNQAGIVTGLIGNNEVFSATIECIPNDASTPTIADAVASCDLPTIPTPVTLGGFPAVTLGATADGINTLKWFYLGGGRINAPADGKWTMTLPLKAFPGITSTTVIS